MAKMAVATLQFIQKCKCTVLSMFVHSQRAKRTELQMSSFNKAKWSKEQIVSGEKIKELQ